MTDTVNSRLLVHSPKRLQQLELDQAKKLDPVLPCVCKMQLLEPPTTVSYNVI